MLAHLRPALAFSARDYELQNGQYHWYPDPVHSHRREDRCLRGRTPGQVARLPGHGRVHRLDWSVVIYGIPYVCYSELASVLAGCVPPWLSLQVCRAGARRALLRYRCRDDALRALQVLCVPGPHGHLGLRSAWARGLPDDALPRSGAPLAVTSARGAGTRRPPHEAPDALETAGAPPEPLAWRPPWHTGSRTIGVGALFPGPGTERLPDGSGLHHAGDVLSWNAAQTLWVLWGWSERPRTAPTASPDSPARARVPSPFRTRAGWPPGDPATSCLVAPVYAPDGSTPAGGFLWPGSAWYTPHAASSSSPYSDDSAEPRAPSSSSPVPHARTIGPFEAVSRWGLAALRSRSPPFGARRVRAQSRPVGTPSTGLPGSPSAASVAASGTVGAADRAAAPTASQDTPAPPGRTAGPSLTPWAGPDLAGALVPPRRKAPPPPSPCETLGSGTAPGGPELVPPAPAGEPPTLRWPPPGAYAPVRAQPVGCSMVQHHERPVPAGLGPGATCARTTGAWLNVGLTQARPKPPPPPLPDDADLGRPADAQYPSGTSMPGAPDSGLQGPTRPHQAGPGAAASPAGNPVARGPPGAPLAAVYGPARGTFPPACLGEATMPWDPPSPAAAAAAAQYLAELLDEAARREAAAGNRAAQTSPRGAATCAAGPPAQGPADLAGGPFPAAFLSDDGRWTFEGFEFERPPPPAGTVWAAGDEQGQYVAVPARGRLQPDTVLSGPRDGGTPPDARPPSPPPVLPDEGTRGPDTPAGESLFADAPRDLPGHLATLCDPDDFGVLDHTPRAFFRVLRSRTRMHHHALREQMVDFEDWLDRMDVFFDTVSGSR